MTDPHGRRAADAILSPLINGATPWWAKALLQLVLWFGPTVLFAAVFLAMWAGWLASPITRNSEALLRIEGKLDTAISRMIVRTTRSELNDLQVTHLLLQTCRNTAKTEAQQTRCDEYWKTPR